MNVIKKFIPIILFLSFVFFSIVEINKIIVPKRYNKYFMLEKELEEKNELYDVQIYGSCHAYTSFNAEMLEDDYGISSYTMANPSEIIPTTYVRMKERFKFDKPKVVLVETWGINPYDTYISSDEILGYYLSNNVERLPLSFDKIELINDFDSLSLLNENFPLAKYKDRIINFELSQLDFGYSFEKANKLFNSKHDFRTIEEMIIRFSNNGYLRYPSTPLVDYAEQQAYVDEEDMLELYPVMTKYLDKIIDLCDENNVELIFYRAPYRSSENELKNINFLSKYLNEKNVKFYDLEKLIDFDYETDFYDYEHLSELGSNKATWFLIDRILESMNESD